MSQNTRIFPLLSLALMTTALPMNASAADRPGVGQLQFQRGVTTQTTMELRHMTRDGIESDAKTLNWQTPSLELSFDLPPNERTRELVLTLSADPMGRVVPNTPLQVSLNGDSPVPVRSNGRGFEAVIPLDVARARTQRNTLRITLPAASGSACVQPAQGAWSVDLANSSLSVQGRSRLRRTRLIDVVTRLNAPSLSPNIVGLIASGPEATQMQALAAQGVGLRTRTVPNFSVSPRGTDFNIVMVPRAELGRYTRDPMILNSTGARVFASQSRPTELIFTADTPAEILATLDAFSTRRLPNVRRPITSVGEIKMQARLDSDLGRVSKRVDLEGLDTDGFSFRINNPSTTSGAVTLRLKSTDVISDDSRLQVMLNGQSLGGTKLDAKTKTVAFDIAPGRLHAMSNTLQLVPELKAAETFTCDAAQQTAFPAVRVARGSKLKLTSDASAEWTDVSRLSASGGVFAEAPATIALPETRRDYEASLRVVAQMARASGAGLTQARYTRAEPTQSGNLLVIGPRRTQLAALGSDFGANMPKPLRESLNGQRRGGVAAQYERAPGQIIGVISTSPGESFTRTADRLIQPRYWNALEGGVARWDAKGVQLAQIAQPVTVLATPQSWLDRITQDKISLPKVKWPEFRAPNWDLPSWQLPEWTAPNVSLPTLSRPDWLTRKTAEVTTVDRPAPQRVTVTEIQSKPLVLRGPIQWDRAPKSMAQKRLDLRSKWRRMTAWTSDQWAKTKRGFGGLENRADRLQDRVKPAGAGLRQRLAGDWAGKRVLRIGERTFTVFGLLLLLAFGLLVLLMSLSGPNSRLGGRH